MDIIPRSIALEIWQQIHDESLHHWWSLTAMQCTGCLLTSNGDRDDSTQCLSEPCELICRRYVEKQRGSRPH